MFVSDAFYGVVRVTRPDEMRLLRNQKRTVLVIYLRILRSLSRILFFIFPTTNPSIHPPTYPGMYALFNVSHCDGKSALPSSLTGKTRTYYIAAEEVIWDYGPSGMNNFKGGKLNASGRYCVLYCFSTGNYMFCQK